MSLSLVPPSHPALLEPARLVTDFDAALILGHDMLVAMKAYGGVGLAAPQVGVSLAIFAMIPGILCINPVLLSHGRDEEVEVEGCLSFPGKRVPVKRWRVITVCYHNGEREIERTLKGYEARIFSHELDHLNGVCILPNPLDTIDKPAMMVT